MENSNYIELFKTTDFGILSVDIGRLKSENGVWSQDVGYCADKAKGIHEEVSFLYKKLVGQEPVNFLFEHFNSGFEVIGKKYYIYQYKVNTELFEDNNATASFSHTLNDVSYKLVEDPRKNVTNENDLVSSQLIRDEIKQKFLYGLNADLLLQTNPKEKFAKSQQAFTNAVGYEYYKRGLPLNYVTIVLLTYERDNCSIFSHSIVIFSSKPLTNIDSSPNDVYEGGIEDPLLELIFENIRSEKYLNRIEELSKRLHKESEKSAKAAIMSRNMSHNLGSHVMSYLKQHLGSIKDMVNDRILAELITGEGDLKKNLNETVDNIELPFLVGMGHFVSYLQERQDFIATIATDFVPYYSTVNFKDGIYDTLNPDKKFERHSNKETVLQTDNILLGNIARSEGLGRQTSPTRSISERGGATLSDIVLKFKDFNGNALEGKFLKESDKPNLIAMRNSLEEMRLCDVSLPGGIVGRQAIFSIVENVIRNAAKHGLWRKVGHLEVTFNVFKKDDINKKELSCYLDDKFNDSHLSLREVFERFYCEADDADDLYFVTLTDNLDFKEDSLTLLRKAIAEPYVNNKGELEGANKGIKEMRISASWLRSLADKKIVVPSNFDPKSDIKWNKPNNSIAPILYARISRDKENDKVGHLQYIFCLVRPKKVAILSSAYDKKKLSEVGKQKLISNSWGVFTPEDFSKESNKSYEFIILLDDNLEQYQEIRRKTSSRLFLLSEIYSKLDDFPHCNTLLDNLYDGSYDPDSLSVKLYKFLSDYNNEKIAVVDDRAWGMIKSSSKGQRVDIGIVSIFQTQDNSIQHPYVYRNHYELSKNFNSVINDLRNIYINNLFVEGISGSNSTDRLVRNEEINEKWGYKHLHVMKERVAIFDERIFSKVFGIEESDFDADPSSKEIAIEKQKLHLMEIQRKKVQAESQQDTVCAIPIIMADILREMEEEKAISISELDGFAAANKETCDSEGYELKSLSSLLEEPRHPIAKDFTGTAFAQKGVNVFTFIKKVANPISQNETDNKEKSDGRSVFYLCGLQDQGEIMSSLYREITNEVDEGNQVIKSQSICKRLAEISWDETKENPLQIQPIDGTPESVIKERFDSFSIHQGILDKFYESFGIKGCPEKKEILTKCFFDYFKKKKTDNSKSFSYKDDSFEHWFLPGMAIHSGRSKPSFSDMPQQVPFIQYASIEHAVFDCKYSLVELLNYARYE